MCCWSRVKCYRLILKLTLNPWTCLIEERILSQIKNNQLKEKFDFFFFFTLHWGHCHQCQHSTQGRLLSTDIITQEHLRSVTSHFLHNSLKHFLVFCETSSVFYPSDLLRMSGMKYHPVMTQTQTETATRETQYPTVGVLKEHFNILIYVLLCWKL